MRNTIITIIAVAIIALIAQYVKMEKETPSPELTPAEQMAAIFESGKCLMCHSQNPSLPFYSSLPVVGNMVRKDAEKAVVSIDLSGMYDALKNGGQIDEVSLAKVEYAIDEGSMPLIQFKMVHWGSGINDDEEDMAMNWVKEYRAKNFSLGTNAPEFANEPVQAIPETVSVDTAKVALGYKLYNDTRLSSDNTISCASCHGLNTGGVDNEQFSEGVGGKLGGVNAPTVFNAFHNFVQFWDGRAATLQKQAAGPPLNPVEMASTSWEQIGEKLAADQELSKAFLAIYPQGFNEETITEAIQEFEKTLITPNSRFDKYLKGDKKALNDDEEDGYEVFKEYECATCHVGVNMGGQSYEKLGLHADYFGIRGNLTDGDQGRFSQTKKEFDMHRFKVPTLRNVALTWPYFHDGTKKTLEEAVDAMLQYQAGLKISAEDKSELMAFLNTLTGEYNGKLLTNDNKQ